MQHNLYIDTIFQGSNYVISQITGSDIEKGNVNIDKQEFLSDDISVMVGINGCLNGHVTFSMNKSLAFKIASTLLGEQVNNEIDEITISCLSEMGNMIMGHTSCIFSEKGIETDITPPAIITGKNVSIIGNKLDVVFCLPVIFNDGQILKINTAFSQKAV